MSPFTGSLGFFPESAQAANVKKAGKTRKKRWWVFGLVDCSLTALRRPRTLSVTSHFSLCQRSKLKPTRGSPKWCKSESETGVRNERELEVRQMQREHGRVFFSPAGGGGGRS